MSVCGTYSCMFVCVFMYVSMHACVCVGACVCVCVYKYNVCTINMWVSQWYHICACISPQYVYVYAK